LNNNIVGVGVSTAAPLELENFALQTGVFPHTYFLRLNPLPAGSNPQYNNTKIKTGTNPV